jgi:hypothetical protein
MARRSDAWQGFLATSAPQTQPKNPRARDVTTLARISYNPTLDSRLSSEAPPLNIRGELVPSVIDWTSEPLPVTPPTKS